MFEERRSLDSRVTLLACSTTGMTPSGETGKRGACPLPPNRNTGNSFPSLPQSENGTTAPTCFIWGLSLCSSMVCMTITPHLFEAYLKCPTKCFLRSLGETGAGNPYADWVCAQNTFFRREGIGV